MAGTPLWVCTPACAGSQAPGSQRPWGAAAGPCACLQPPPWVLGASERQWVGQDSGGRGKESTAGSEMADVAWVVTGFVKREVSKNY